jgi:hypothetical protein
MGRGAGGDMHAFDLTPDPALARKPVSRFLTRIRLVADRKYLGGRCCSVVAD